MSFDIHNLPTSVTTIDHNKDKDIKIMVEPKGSSASSTPPATHTEHLDHDMGKEYRQTSVVGLPPLEEHGVGIDHKVPQENVVQAQPDLLWSRIRRTMREPFAEFFG